MYFTYVHSFALQKSSEIGNYWMSMQFYGDKISKWHMIMNKRTPFPGYRLLPSPSTKLKLKDNHYETPCSIGYISGIYWLVTAWVTEIWRKTWNWGLQISFYPASASINYGQKMPLFGLNWDFTPYFVYLFGQKHL